MIYGTKRNKKKALSESETDNITVAALFCELVTVCVPLRESRFVIAPEQVLKSKHTQRMVPFQKFQKCPDL
jgi:hypothetical protein